jgi:uncharacterized protein
LRRPVTSTFEVGGLGKSTTIAYRAAEPLGVTLVLAHGAGAPQSHPFMTSMARLLGEKGVDVVTFDFLYAAAGRKMPDRVGVLETTWRSAITHVRARGGLPSERLYIGGKSMGGRMATHIASAGEGLVIDGVVLLGYPLRPAGKTAPLLREILDVTQPMLVAQGTRDPLGTASELEALLEDKPRARVHVVQGGDHSFQLPKKDGAAAQAREFDRAAAAIASFVAKRGRRR